MIKPLKLQLDFQFKEIIYMASNEMTKEEKNTIVRRLEESRTRLMFRTPFYGNLLLHMRFSLASCGTAATDMKRIMFDPAFINRISDEELDFVLKHEIMHCVLQHCVRGRNLNQYFFNIACDIVVNSNIMQTMGVETFLVDGVEAMHLTPSMDDGYLYSAEEVYDMLMNKYKVLIRDVEQVLKEVEDDYGVGFDDHDIWKIVPLDSVLSDQWKKNFKDACKAAGEFGHYPPCARKLLDDLKQESKVNWKVVLNDFIKAVHDKYDFSFVPPDRRFSAGDFILPSYAELTSEKVENLWFLIDTSGSISTEELTLAMGEVKSAIEQFTYLSGKISFFDTEVSEPVSFDSVDTLSEVTPIGGGGTSFRCIFKYMKEYFEDELPTAVIVLTDGYASYPAESNALDVPVLWIISGRNEEDAPWGVTIHI